MSFVHSTVCTHVSTHICTQCVHTSMHVPAGTCPPQNVQNIRIHACSHIRLYIPQMHGCKALASLHTIQAHIQTHVEVQGMLSHKTRTTIHTHKRIPRGHITNSLQEAILCHPSPSPPPLLQMHAHTNGFPHHEAEHLL